MIKILCIIPARSGSKGIPNKNIKIYNGKPLIYWTINQAKSCKHINNMRIIVSTDHDYYKQIALEHGAEVPFLRPSNISGDLSTDYEFMKHAVDWLQNNENYIPDIILHLRPTSPLRKIQDIDNALEIFIKNKHEYDSLRSVVLNEKSPYKMYNIYDNTLVPLFTNINEINEPYNQCRQILPKCYLHNGYIDILNTSILYNKTISGDKILPYLMDNTETNDIDEYKDWHN